MPVGTTGLSSGFYIAGFLCRVTGQNTVRLVRLCAIEVLLDQLMQAPDSFSQRPVRLLEFATRALSRSFSGSSRSCRLATGRVRGVMTTFSRNRARRRLPSNIGSRHLQDRSRLMPAPRFLIVGDWLMTSLTESDTLSAPLEPASSTLIQILDYRPGQAGHILFDGVSDESLYVS